MKISEIKTFKQLANYLRCEEAFLMSFFSGNIFVFDHQHPVEVPELTKHQVAIEVFYIPKKNRRLGYRKVCCPITENLTNTLKILYNYLKKLYHPGPATQGFVHGRSIKTNAAHHLAKKEIISIDLDRFFETISISMVESAFLRLGYSSFASAHLSQLVTLDNKLTQGYSTSPVLANIVVERMDKELLNLAGEFVTYTRYADDLYFSTNDKLPELNDIEKIIASNGFAINPLKTKLMKRGSWQYVTGLTVFDDTMPRISKKMKRNLRLEIHYLKKFGYLSQILRKLNYTPSQYRASLEIKKKVDLEIFITISRISGWLSFIGSIEKKAADKLKREFDEIEDHK